ncbi:hypothetical protein Fcan01_17369 [Folsomia candida]|uniref:Uncharacterized protein n=1 Tax=Folsomia candida TaxID=158441 RepID=A0A226DRY4_FOLCA|nr:hypothetical protein Fcan01_17369 [Folsomia candida]
MTTYWTVEDNYIQRFENFMRPEDSIRPVLARYLAKNIVASLTNTLKSYTTKFRTFTTSIFQGESLTTLSNWEAIPSPSPTPPTIPTTTESPVFGCLPVNCLFLDDCIDTYYRTELRNLYAYAVKHGIEQIPLYRTFSNRTLTTMFDLDITYSDITIDNFWNIIGSPSVTTDLAGGTFNGYWTSEVLLSGTFTANGTILGVPTSQSGR